MIPIKLGTTSDEAIPFTDVTVWAKQIDPTWFNEMADATMCVVFPLFLSAEDYERARIKYYGLSLIHI